MRAFANWLMTFACLLIIAYSYSHGAHAKAPAQAAALALLSAGTWLASAIIPLHSEDTRTNPWVVFGMNAIAASATGGSVLLSLDGGWQTALFGA